MQGDYDLIIQAIVSKLDDSLSRFATKTNEKLGYITDNLNRCEANLTVLEKKIEGSQYSR